ncbi:hypothetical protein EJB05_48415, partial [Eragrostis curvula]
MEKVESRGGLALAAVAATLLLLPPPHGAAATGPESNCTRSCGNISIPYPFGIEPGCYHATGFNLTCDRSYRPPKLFLGDGTVPVLEISVSDSTVRINSSRLLYTAETGVSTVNGTWGRGLPAGGPFFLSESRSSVALVGCGTQVDVRGADESGLIASCTATCPLDGSQRIVVETGSACSGVGCCQANIVLGYDTYNIQINKLKGSAYALTTSVYLVDRGFKYTEDMSSIYGLYPEALPATLEWVISNGTCSSFRDTLPVCQGMTSVCHEGPYNVANRGYRCGCADGYQGNPYLVDGCQDIDECSSPDIYPCYGDCKNTPGHFICRCRTGYYGNASVPNGCKDINECENQEAYSCYGVCVNFPGTFQCQCPVGTYGNPFTKGGCTKIKKSSSSGLSIGLGVSGGTLLLLVALFGPLIIRKFRQHKVKKMKEKYFNQNHGLLLQQLISHKADIGQRMIINLKELEKATNDFDRARIVGGGGHGVVFKGILDLHVVAIKKAKIVVQREIDEFINEVAVNHRNVVKLLGCCLETEVPLLVYEFVSNGTLYHHLHVDGPVSLKWDDRIRIAIEVSRALSYLHSAASMPIFHRDIKSSNILLDDTLTAKVSDFGASRYIPIDQTGVTTAIQGTIGYLDPMYYYTGRLTDKSDVFSFGVLLLELLTRKKPFIYRSNSGDGLVSHFATLLTEGKLVDIIDPQVMEEESGEVQEVSTLATMCTKLKGEDRPTMREVEMILGNLLVKKKQVLCNTIANEYDRVECVTTESSRQYTMEEEVLLSARRTHGEGRKQRSCVRRYTFHATEYVKIFKEAFIANVLVVQMGILSKKGDAFHSRKTSQVSCHYFLRLNHWARSWWWNKSFAFSTWCALHNSQNQAAKEKNDEIEIFQPKSWITFAATNIQEGRHR